MNPNTVFSASLVTSLVLWYPSMQACLRSDLDLAPAGLRYLAALLLSRLALGFLARLVNAYRATQDPAVASGHHAATGMPDGPPSALAATDATATSSTTTPHRRRSDPPAGSDPDTPSMAA